MPRRGSDIPRRRPEESTPNREGNAAIGPEGGSPQGYFRKTANARYRDWDIEHG